jgi:hypothetical protein
MKLSTEISGNFIQDSWEYKLFLNESYLLLCNLNFKELQNFSNELQKASNQIDSFLKVMHGMKNNQELSIKNNVISLKTKKPI